MTLLDGRFEPGPDPRRHQLTPTERELGGILGYRAAEKKLAGDATALAWLFRRVRANCRRRRRRKEPAE